MRRQDLFPAAIDNVVHPAAQIQAPFVVHLAQVTGPQPFAMGLFSGLGRTAPIAQHPRWPCHPYLADRTRRHILVLVIDQPHFYARRRKSDRGAMVMNKRGREERAGRSEFGKTITVNQLQMRPAVVKFTRPGLRHGRSAEHDEAGRAEHDIAFVHQHQHAQHAGNSSNERGGRLAESLNGILAMKLRHQHRLAADDQHLPQLVDKARIVEQGRKHDRVVVRAGIQKPLIGGGCFENGPRAQNRAFWQPRRTRCEAYDRRIVGGG